MSKIALIHAPIIPVNSIQLPDRPIKKPKPPLKKSKKALNSYKFLAEQYVKNRDKYAYANAWCENRGWRFIVLTEKTLK